MIIVWLLTKRHARHHRLGDCQVRARWTSLISISMTDTEQRLI